MSSEEAAQSLIKLETQVMSHELVSVEDEYTSLTFSACYSCVLQVRGWRLH